MAINRLGFAERLQGLQGLETLKEAEKIVDMFLETLEVVTQEHKEEIQFTGYFGTSIDIKKASIKRNPKTGEAVNVLEKTVMSIKVGKKLKVIK